MSRRSTLCRTVWPHMLCLIIFMMGAVPPAHAAICGMMPNYQEGADIDIAMGRITVPAGAAVGEAFYSQTFPIPGNLYAIVSCAPKDTTDWRVSQGNLTVYSNVYSTNIDGVGMRTSWVPAGSSTSYYAGEKTTWRLGMAGTSGSWAQNTVMVSVTGSVVVELVKTAEKVGSGALSGGVYTKHVAQMAYPFNSGVFLSTFISGGGSEVVPETGTCSIGDSQVDLDSVPFGRFHGVGSTAGETPFPIVFTCSGSDGAITLTMDADALDDGSQGLLKPDAGELSAGCIALQVLDADTHQPVGLGSTQVVGKVVDGSGTFSLPYRVRYYQTRAGAGCVSPGAVKGRATVTVRYQ